MLCALGGDGFMLQTLHRHGSLGKPVFGMKLGTVGFLMNQFRDDDLVARLAQAEPAKLRPLEMLAQTESGRHHRLAGLQRGLAAAADAPGRAREHRSQRPDPGRRTDLRWRAGLHPSRQHRLQLLRARTDPAAGLAHPGADPDRAVPAAALARRILKADIEVRFRVLDPYKRPVSVTADSHETRDVVEVTIRESRDRLVTLLFDPEHNLEERILSEQFMV